LPREKGFFIGYHDVVGEFFRQFMDKVDEVVVVGDEISYPIELAALVGNGVFDVLRRLLRLLYWEQRR